MNKLILTSLLTLSLFANSQAQSWIDFGVKGGWGPTLLFNQKIFDNQSVNHKLSYAPTFGAKIGYNFNMEHEITFDVMFSQFKQDFTYSVTDSTTKSDVNYNSTFGYKSTDLLFMYRHNKNGSYFEIGPKLSLIKSSYNNFDLNTFAPMFSPDQVVPQLTSLAVGFGSYFIGTENFGVTGGLRMSYSFNNIISTNGNNVYAPTYLPSSNNGVSHPLFFQVIFEANYDLAYMAKAKCGRKKILMF